MTLISTSSGKPKKPKKPRNQKNWHGMSRNQVILLGAGLALAGLYVVGYFVTGLRMPANATVAGVDVSGMSPVAAQQKIDKELTPHLDDPVQLSHGEQEFQIGPDEAGLTFNLEKTVDEAGGSRSWNPANMWGLFFGNHEFGTELDVDGSKLETVISTFAGTIDEPEVEPQITFEKAKPVARKPADGRVVSRKDAAEVIKGAYLIAKEPVAIPTVVVEPTVDQAALDEAMETFAKPAMSGPVMLKSGGKDAELPTTAFAPALVVQVEGGALVPSIDPKKLAEPLQDSTTGLGKEAQDALITIESGKPVIVPSKPGLGLQPEELAKSLLPVLPKSGAERSLQIEAKIVEPEFTTKDAKALKITEKVSEFSTTYDPAAYRDINQGRAAQLLDGTLVKPGETFSFNDTLGERTVANGFTQGTVINGGVFREELGGGVSQVVTTTYNAAFFAGMTDIEHHPHDFYISRYPVGREATVYWGSLDLKFRNDTKYGVLVRAYIQKSAPGRQGVMTVQMYSTKVWDIKAGVSSRRNFRKPGLQYDPTDRCVAQSPVQGFDIDVYRTFYRGGKQVKSETDTANYKAADEVRCEEKPKEDPDD